MAEIPLALGILLGKDMTQTLLLVADFARPGDRVPLRSGFSCFHFWHDYLSTRSQGTRTPGATEYITIQIGWVVLFLALSRAHDNGHHPSFHHGTPVQNVSYIILG
jgi:hypothetical protein